MYYEGTAVGSIEVNNPKTIYKAKDSYAPFYVSDWNGDGLLDILILENTFSIIRNIGTVSNPIFDTDNQMSVECKDADMQDETFPTSGDGHDFFNAGDINGDGLLDIVGARPTKSTETNAWGNPLASSDIDIYYNTGTNEEPTFSFSYRLHEYTDVSLGIKSKPALVDINGDGALDIISSESRPEYPKTCWRLIIWAGIPEVTSNENIFFQTLVKTDVAYNPITKTISLSAMAKLNNLSLITLSGRSIKLSLLKEKTWKIPSSLTKGIFIIKGVGRGGVGRVLGKIIL